VPGFGAGTRGLRQRLTIIVGAGETAEVAAVADAGAGQKKTGVGGLCWRGLRRKNQE
jgi:hypothetical protein